jgi:hypothetical protein
MATIENDSDYTDLKRKMLEIGIPIPGTIHALYARCGSPTCPCATDNLKRHGPYYRWHYRKGNRCIAQGIKEEDLMLFKEWIENRKKIYKIVDKILKIGARQAASYSTGASAPRRNSRKTMSPMRGK